MNKEFLKMQKLAGLITESQMREMIGDIDDTPSPDGKFNPNADAEADSNGEEVYRSNPYNELYKVTNLPKGNLQNPAVKDVINTIVSDAYPDSDDELFLNDEDWVEEVNSYLNRLPSTDVVYIHTDGEGRLSIVDTLEKFSDGYKTEEEWEVKSWDKI